MSIKKTLFIFICLVTYLGNINAQAAKRDSINILFIGNSFTVLNDEPLLFSSLARIAKIPVHVESFTHLGVGVDFFIAKDSCWLAIKSRKWDYIVFQDLQSYYYDSLAKFPPHILADNLKFQDSIKSLIPCVKIIYVAGWEMQGGIPARFHGDNTILMINRILSNYAYLNNQPNVHNTISPVGVAWKQSEKLRPDLVLVSSDDRHPSPSGSYLYACEMFCTIFRQNPTNLAYSFSISAEAAWFLRNIAYKAFMDTIDYTNVDAITLQCTKTKNCLMADSGYSNYKWYRNDTLIAKSTFDSLNITDTNSYYSVTCTNANGCTISSFTQYLSTTHKSAIYTETLPESGFSVYPNPCSEKITVNPGATHFGNAQISVYNMNGEMVRHFNTCFTPFQDYEIDTSPFLKGIYIIEVCTNGSISREKVVVYK